MRPEVNYANLDAFYVNGEFVRPPNRQSTEVIDPATEAPIAKISLAEVEDLERAVAAAKEAFKTFGFASKEERLDLLERILVAYDKKAEELAMRMTLEIGTPISFSRESQVGSGRAHILETMNALRELDLNPVRRGTMLAREPIGVCGLITPWNWPMLQIVTKVAPALAAGCTMVLKPSQFSPLSSVLFAEILHDAGVPPGVFNMLNGSGSKIGTAMAEHPDIDMVSFTGSTRAGVLVARNAASTIKRVHQELGGKSPNIILPGVKLGDAVTKAVHACYLNNGQSCSAPTRLLVPADQKDEVAQIAKAAAENYTVGDTLKEDTLLGPVVNARQYESVRNCIQAGIDEGATLVAGGTSLPSDINRGYYVQATVFTDVEPSMTISRDEIFGPVLAIQTYNNVDEAIELANDTVYGLAAYVQSEDMDMARMVASKMRAGSVQINYPAGDNSAPFGGYKQSGNGREYGEYGIEAFQEIKSVIGYQ